MIKKRLTVPVALIVAITSVILCLHRPSTTDGQDIKYRIIEIEKGWGYEIAINGQVCIHQDCIPAFPGNTAFTDSRSAERVAKAVVSRLAANRSPSLTEDEVSELLERQD